MITSHWALQQWATTSHNSTGNIKEYADTAGRLILIIMSRDSKSGERGEHARAIFFAPAVQIFGLWMRTGCALVLILAPAVLMFDPNSLGN